MVNDLETAETSPPTIERSAAALRMQRHRARRRRGLRCLLIELREAEIDQFVRRKRLSAGDREDPEALRRTLREYLHDTPESQRRVTRFRFGVTARNKAGRVPPLIRDGTRTSCQCVLLPIRTAWIAAGRCSCWRAAEVCWTVNDKRQQLARPAHSDYDGSFPAHSARTEANSGTRASGRVEPFPTLSANDCYFALTGRLESP
jgi:hypothetical protein